MGNENVDGNVVLPVANGADYGGGAGQMAGSAQTWASPNASIPNRPDYRAGDAGRAYNTGYRAPEYRAPEYRVAGEGSRGGGGYPPAGGIVGGPGSIMPVTPVPAPPKQTKKGRAPMTFAGTIATALVVGLIAGGGAGFGTYYSMSGNNKTVPANTSQAVKEKVSDPVISSTSTNPDWMAVAAAVRPSVVALAVETDIGEASGSGVIIDDQGHILTNNHVVEAATQEGASARILVSMYDGAVYKAQVLGADPTTDLAVVKLIDPPSELTVASMGDSDDVKVGQSVAAIGNPLGLSSTVTTGIVSALDRPVTVSMDNQQDIMSSGQSQLVVTNAIQVDASINPGNSGGPLFDSTGRVIGINSSIATTSQTGQSGSIGLGFAIPINLGRSVAHQLIVNGRVRHAYLGVRLGNTTATSNGVTRVGALITESVAGGPAQKAGIRKGDVVVAINDTPVVGADSLTGWVRRFNVGDEVNVTVVRDSKEVIIKVKLGTLEDS